MINERLDTGDRLTNHKFFISYLNSIAGVAGDKQGDFYESV
jgi:hypothetical protein